MTPTRTLSLLLCSIALSGLAACSNSNSDNTTNAPPIVALFDPASGNIPLTNDLFFRGSTEWHTEYPHQRYARMRGNAH